MEKREEQQDNPKNGTKKDVDAFLHWEHAFSRRPVRLWSLQYLAYFYFTSLRADRSPQTRRVIADVTDRRTVRLRDTETLFLKTRLDRELPTIGFANTDSEACLIRIAVLSPTHLLGFRSVELNFEFQTTRDSSQSLGTLKELLEPLAEEWNIWQGYTVDIRFGDSHELGQVNLIMEHTPNGPPVMPPKHEELASLLASAMEGPELRVKKVRVRPFSARRVFISIKGDSQLERSGELLEVCREIGAEFGYLRDNIGTVESYAANSVSEEVARRIEESSGLIQFLMADEPGGSFTWIESEFFFATMLGIPTVRIVDPRLRNEVRFLQDKAAIFLPEFASNERLRAAIRRAFSELDERVRLL
ncbi:MAG: hypothetical protein SF066_03410 [Thermoanaerobaculia bacterium]|nr:hypothetical protein [Thermoanaerobaculia bacterium]